MFNLKVLPELARHEFFIDYATGNFTLKIIDYAQQDILKILLSAVNTIPALSVGNLICRTIHRS